MKKYLLIMLAVSVSFTLLISAKNVLKNRSIQHSLPFQTQTTNSNFFNQQIPFQGKLEENGLPVNGKKDFQFQILDGNVNWTEFHPNIDVDNGIYFLYLGSNTPFPSSLFTSQEYHDLIVKVSNTPIDTVRIFVPIVPFNWIRNLPELDTSHSNELQTMIYNPITGELSISDGNTVTISPSTYGAFDSLVIGAIDTTDQSTVSQNTFVNNITPNSIWQSFQATNDGRLTEIITKFANISTSDIVLKIYNNEGNGTVPFYSQTFPFSNFPAALQDQTFLINNSVINLTAGSRYTFEIISTGGSLAIAHSNANPYPAGRSSHATTSDLYFKIQQEIITPAAMTISDDAIVANRDLHVKGGRIKDKTGFVMPVGSIIPYAGATVPEGWLLCDGSAIDRGVYPDLFAAIGVAHGVGNNSTTFNLPDLRGQFLRGVDDGRGLDPRANQRTHSKGGNTGDNVGGEQSYATRMPNNSFTIATSHPQNKDGKHSHTTTTKAVTGISFGTKNYNSKLASNAGYNSNSQTKANLTTDPNGGIHSHTGTVNGGGDPDNCPTNVAVNFIIKY